MSRISFSYADKKNFKKVRDGVSMDFVQHICISHARIRWNIIF